MPFGTMQQQPSCRGRGGVNFRFKLWIVQRKAWAQRRGPCPPPWIFIHDTDKVKGSLIVLFFGLAFSVAIRLEILLPMPLAARCQTLKHMLKSSIPTAVANFASACKYLCSKNCLVFNFMFVFRLIKINNKGNFLFCS